MSLDKWQKDGICRMFEEGKTQREIANAVGCTLVSVNRAIKKLSEKKQQRETQVQKSLEQSHTKINLDEVPTVDSIKTDILIVYRRSLYELNERLPMMTDEQVYAVSMKLLQELNNGNTES